MTYFKKIFTAVSVLALMLALTACSGMFGGDGGTNTPPDNTVKYSQIIIESTDFNILDARNAITDITGMIPVMLYNDSTARDGEIVIGNTDRAITAAAKKALESAIASSTKYDCGYIIYSDGKNIAIYWQLDGMDTIAIADFINECVEKKQLKVEEGFTKTGLYNRSEYENEKYWLALEAIAEPGVVQALRTLNSYYDGATIVDWMANLYDPERGGFYYSISARDNAGFLPDVESTRQITQLIVSSGGLDSRNDFPPELKAKILEFTLNLQSATDGYFYHPQWPQDKSKLNTDRYGRDISSALGIISDMNLDIDGDGIEDDIYPLYCAPNGTKCKLHKDGGSCSFPLEKIPASDALGLGVSAAVSRVTDSYVKATAVSSHPDYSSREAFSAWLEEYNASIKEDSGKAHNLSAISGEIRAHGYEDIVIAHLERVQAEVYEEQLANGEEPTGLWQRNVDYRAVWGLLKYNSYFNSSKEKPLDLKYIPHIINTCIKVIALPADGGYAANDIYNMWQAIQRVINHVKNRYGMEEVTKIYEMLRADAESLIRNSILKLEPFKRSDGSFSYKTSGISSTTIYGTSIAMGVVEGDVNAVSLCVQMYEGIFISLGYDQVPLFTKSDGERFVDTILNSEPIQKEGRTSDVIDFEDGLMPNGFSASLKGPGSVGEITEDPDSGEHGKVFNLHSMPIEGSGSDSVSIKPYNLGGACYVVDMDMYFASGTNGDKYSFQLYYGDAYMIEFYFNSKNITIYADKSGGGLAGDVIATVPYDTWFRFTAECYMPNDINDIDTPVLRVWINEEFVCETNDYLVSGSGTYNDSFQVVKLWSMKKKETNLYVDNCFVAIVEKEYDDSDEDFYDARTK
jgi:hypothetical protein